MSDDYITLREQMLNEAADLCGSKGARDNNYGDPAPNMALAFRLFGEIMAASAMAHDRIDEAEAGALMLVSVKLARIATGPDSLWDNYVDAAAYIAIAGEVSRAKMERENAETIEDILNKMQPGDRGE